MSFEHPPEGQRTEQKQLESEIRSEISQLKVNAEGLQKDLEGAGGDALKAKDPKRQMNMATQARMIIYAAGALIGMPMAVNIVKPEYLESISSFMKVVGKTEVAPGVPIPLVLMAALAAMIPIMSMIEDRAEAAKAGKKKP